jgi:hypothetical protein
MDFFYGLNGIRFTCGPVGSAEAPSGCQTSGKSTIVASAASAKRATTAAGHKLPEYLAAKCKRVLDRRAPEIHFRELLTFLCAEIQANQHLC